MHFDANRNPIYFSSPAAINAGIKTGAPIQLPYSSEAGERKFFRGNGYLDLDSSLPNSRKIAKPGRPAVFLSGV